MCSAVFTATLLLERNFHPFMELPEQQQIALNDVLQAVLLDEELLVVLEQVVRLETPRGNVSAYFSGLGLSG